MKEIEKDKITHHRVLIVMIAVQYIAYSCYVVVRGGFVPVDLPMSFNFSVLAVEVIIQLSQGQWNISEEHG